MVRLLKTDATKLTELLKRLSVDVLGKPMTKADEARFQKALGRAKRVSGHCPHVLSVQAALRGFWAAQSR